MMLRCQQKEILFINADIIQKNIDSILEEIDSQKKKENHSDCVLKETEALEIKEAVEIIRK